MPRTIKTIKTYSDEDEQFLAGGNGVKPPDPPPPPIPPGPPGFADFKSRFLNQKKSNARVYIKTPEGREYCFVDTLDKIQSEETLRQYHERSKRAHEPGQYWIAVEYNGEVFEDYGPILIAPQKPEPVASMQGSYMGSGVADYIHQRITALEQNQNQRQSPNDLLTLVDAIGRLDQMRGSHQPPQERLSADETLKWIEVGKTLSSAGTDINGWSILRDAVSAIAGAVVPIAVPHLAAWWANRNAAEPANSPNPPPPSNAPNPAQSNIVPPPLGSPEPKPLPAPVKPLYDDAHPDPLESISPLDLAIADEATLKLLRDGVSFLKGEAKKGTHPAQWIDYVLNNDWQPANDKLISAIAWNNLSAFVQHVDKEIESAPYREWFEYFYNGLRSAVIPADPVGVDTGGAGGDRGHA